MRNVKRSIRGHTLIAVLASMLPAVAACGAEDDSLFSSAYGASSVHLKGGKNAEPAFTDLGLALNAASELAGLGEEAVNITLTAAADVTATCTNSGQNQPPGQNPAPITVSGSQTLVPSEIDTNGNTPFSVTTEAPPTLVAGAPGCPNAKNWTEEITELSFTGAVITVDQGGLVLTVTCEFSPATSDGAVPASTVTCTSS